MVEMTVTMNLQAKTSRGWSGIQKHTEHDSNLQHSNKDIDFERTQFNSAPSAQLMKKKAVELTAWREKKFGDYVRQHDLEQRTKNHPERQYGTVAAFLKKSKPATGVWTIGSLETTNALIKQVAPAGTYHTVTRKDGSEQVLFDLSKPAGVDAAKTFYDVYNRTFKHLMKSDMLWDKGNDHKVHVNDFLHIGRWRTNLDEGAPHVHFEVGTAGKTKKGKPSAALNAAITSLYIAVNGKVASGRVATAWLRDALDRFALETLQRELEKTYGSKASKAVSFVRKTKNGPVITGQSMTDYKATKQQLTQLQKQVKAQQDDLDRLTAAVETVKAKKKELEEQKTAAATEAQKAAEQLQKAQETIQKANALQTRQQELRNATRSLQEQLDTANDQLQQKRQQRQRQAKEEADVVQLELQEPITDQNVEQVEKQIRSRAQQQLQTLQTLQKSVGENQKLVTDWQELKKTASAISEKPAEFVKDRLWLVKNLMNFRQAYDIAEMTIKIFTNGSYNRGALVLSDQPSKKDFVESSVSAESTVNQYKSGKFYNAGPVMYGLRKAIVSMWSRWKHGPFQHSTRSELIPQEYRPQSQSAQPLAQKPVSKISGPKQDGQWQSMIDDGPDL